MIQQIQSGIQLQELPNTWTMQLAIQTRAFFQQNLKITMANFILMLIVVLELLTLHIIRIKLDVREAYLIQLKYFPTIQQMHHGFLLSEIKLLSIRIKILLS